MVTIPLCVARYSNIECMTTTQKRQAEILVWGGGAARLFSRDAAMIFIPTAVAVGAGLGCSCCIYAHGVKRGQSHHIRLCKILTINSAKEQGRPGRHAHLRRAMILLRFWQ